MFESKYGPITNPRTGETKDIVVKAVTPNNLRDVLIGGGIVTIGLVYLTLSVFRNGARAFEEAEYKTLEDLDLFKK